MPARLSSPNEPMCSTTKSMSASVISRSRSITSRVGEARLRPPAEVHHDLDQGLAVGQRVDRRDDLRRQRREQGVEVVDRFALAIVGSHADLHRSIGLADAGRHEGRFGDADEGFLHEQRDSGDRLEALLLEPPIDR